MSQEAAAMSWFKAPNLLLIMRSTPIQMSESLLGKEGFFLASSSIWDIHCLALCVGSACAQLTLCWCGVQTCCSLSAS